MFVSTRPPMSQVCPHSAHRSRALIQPRQLVSEGAPLSMCCRKVSTPHEEQMRDLPCPYPKVRRGYAPPSGHDDDMLRLRHLP